MVDAGSGTPKPSAYQDINLIEILLELLLIVEALAGTAVAFFFAPRVKATTCPKHSSLIFRHNMIQILIMVLLIIESGAGIFLCSKDPATIFFRIRISIVLLAMTSRTIAIIYCVYITMKKHEDIILKSNLLTEDQFEKIEQTLGNIRVEIIAEQGLNAAFGVFLVGMIFFYDCNMRLLAYLAITVRAFLEVYPVNRQMTLEGKLDPIYRKFWMDDGSGRVMLQEELPKH